MTEESTLDIVQALRQHQEEDPVVGRLFLALHTFLDRTAERFYSEYPDLPHPVLAMEKDRSTRLGYYTSMDGYRLIHRINLNPYTARTGRDAAETVAHEQVHLWQHHVGRPCKRNYHNKEFHQRMRVLGIITDGNRGMHKGYTDDNVWGDWMEENKDLELDQFILPGMHETKRKKRNVPTWHCPTCGVSFRCRKEVNLMCMDCDTEIVLKIDGTK